MKKQNNINVAINITYASYRTIVSHVSSICFCVLTSSCFLFFLFIVFFLFLVVCVWWGGGGVGVLAITLAADYSNSWVEVLTTSQYKDLNSLVSGFTLILE